MKVFTESCSLYIQSISAPLQRQAIIKRNDNGADQTTGLHLQRQVFSWRDSKGFVFTRRTHMLSEISSIYI